MMWKCNNNIQDIIEEYISLQENETVLSSQIYNHYEPIITKLGKEKDSERLEYLLNILPECSTKSLVYQELRKLRK